MSPSFSVESPTLVLTKADVCAFTTKGELDMFLFRKFGPGTLTTTSGGRPHAGDMCHDSETVMYTPLREFKPAVDRAESEAMLSTGPNRFLLRRGSGASSNEIVVTAKTPRGITHTILERSEDNMYHFGPEFPPVPASELTGVLVRVLEIEPDVGPHYRFPVAPTGAQTKVRVKSGTTGAVLGSVAVESVLVPEVGPVRMIGPNVFLTRRQPGYVFKPEEDKAACVANKRGELEAVLYTRYGPGVLVRYTPRTGARVEGPTVKLCGDGTTLLMYEVPKEFLPGVSREAAVSMLDRVSDGIILRRGTRDPSKLVVSGRQNGGRVMHFELERSPRDGLFYTTDGSSDGMRVDEIVDRFEAEIRTRA